MKVVLISAPFRAQTPWEIELNVRRAEALAYRIIRKNIGIIPILAHAMYKNFYGSVPYEFWMQVSKELLTRSDSLLLEERWAHSEGCVIEKSLCKDLKKPYFHDLEDLFEWKLNLGDRE